MLKRGEILTESERLLNYLSLEGKNFLGKSRLEKKLSPLIL
jgi:hypothetical protein